MCQGSRNDRTSLRTLVDQINAPARPQPSCRRACVTSFVLMSAFVTMYNFLDHRLLQPPHSLSHSLVGLVFLAYLGGTVSSPIAGHPGNRNGRLPVLRLSILLAHRGALPSPSDVDTFTDHVADADLRIERVTSC
jgi:MFS transporter, YNFM family, putative membrane transport protein